MKGWEERFPKDRKEEVGEGSFITEMKGCGKFC